MLWNKRKSKIEKRDHKIEKAKLKTQQVTPSYVDQLIGFYERKNTSQKDRMYILLELQKYYSPKIIQFFFKLNDTELNKQLRWIAFYHLHSFNYQPRARKQKYMQASVYKGYKRDKIEMRGDRAEMSDFPLYLNTVAGGLDCRNQAIGGFSFVVKIYALPVVEIIGQFLYLLG